MDKKTKQLLKEGIDKIKQDRISMGIETSKEEEEEIAYFFDNYDKLSNPTIKWKDGQVKNLEWESQHKVPRAFLNLFSDGDNALFQYDIKEKTLSNKKINTKNLLTEDDYYVVKDKDKNRSYFFEKYIFSYLFESKISDVIKKIKNKEPLIEGDLQRLSWFIAYQYVRTDSFINFLKFDYESMIKNMSMYSYDTFEQFEQMVLNMQKKTGKDVWNIKELYEYAKKWDYDVDVHKESIIINALSLWNKIWPEFLDWNYEILETRKKSFFLVSDNPFFIIPPKDYPKWMWIWLGFPPNSEKIIPINDKQCLRIFLTGKANPWISIKYKTINYKETNRINSYICKNATRFILWKDQRYMRELVKKVDFHKSYKEKTENRFFYDKDLKLIITKQLYPL